MTIMIILEHIAIVNNITIVMNVIKIMCMYVSYCNVCVSMQQIHLSTLERYCTLKCKCISGQDYNVHVN